MEQFRLVKPGDLRLSPGRQDGPVAARYHRQVRRFGADTNGMPLIEVTEGKDGELMINDGVTRATRVHNLAPDQDVLVEIIDVRSNADLTRLKRVRDVSPT